MTFAGASVRHVVLIAVSALSLSTYGQNLSQEARLERAKKIVMASAHAKKQLTSAENSKLTAQFENFLSADQESIVGPQTLQQLRAELQKGIFRTLNFHPIRDPRSVADLTLADLMDISSTVGSLGSYQ